MSGRLVSLNGQLLPEAEAKLSIYDSAVIYGDMVYEVVRTFHGQPYRLRAHLERLAEGLQTMAIAPGMTLEELEQRALETLAANRASAPDVADWQVQIGISRGPASAFHLAFAPHQRRPTVMVSCYPLCGRLARLAGAYATGIELFVSRQPAIPPYLLPLHVKVRARLHYRLADLEAAQRGREEWPVLVDPDGNLTEGTSYNLFAVCQGRLWTPPAADVVVGITRDTVLALADELGIATLEDKLPRTRAQTADELFVTSTSIGILHARAFDGILLSRGQMGPVTSRLREALHGAFGLDIAEQARECARRMAADASA